MIEHVFEQKVTHIEELVAELGSDDLDRVPGGSLSDRLVALLHVGERVRAEVVRTIGQWDEVKEWKGDGALSGASWLASHADTTRADALRLVHAGRHVRRHEQTAAVLAAGDVSVQNVEMMAAGAFHREEIFAEEEAPLLAAAAVQRPQVFWTTVRQWCNRADQRLLDEDRFDAASRVYLRGKPMIGGLVKIDGVLESDGWKTVLDALQPLARPQAGPTVAPLSPGRRLADALVEFAAQGGRGTKSGRRRRTSPAADIVIDYETVLGIAQGDLLSRLCDIEGVGPVPLSTIERLLCDCSVGRVLMRGESEVLDLGRRTDVPSRAQRRALARRDKHCRFPGCDRPVHWTDTHHIIHWTRGGPTDLDNLVLLCRRHHTMCHEGGWELTRNADGTVGAALRPGRAPPVAATAA